MEITVEEVQIEEECRVTETFYRPSSEQHNVDGGILEGAVSYRWEQYSRVSIA